MCFTAIYYPDTKALSNRRDDKTKNFCLFTTPCHFIVERVVVTVVIVFQIKTFRDEIYGKRMNER